MIQNAYRIKSTGEILKSCHRYDYFTIGDWMIDGGNDYIRVGYPIGVNFSEATESLVLKEDSSLGDCLNKAVWGTRGKDGKQPLTYKLVKDLEPGHLKNILEMLTADGSTDSYIYRAVQYWYNIMLNKKG